MRLMGVFKHPDHALGTPLILLIHMCNTLVCCDDKFYEEVCATAMQSRVSIVDANIMMEKIAIRALPSAPMKLLFQNQPVPRMTLELLNSINEVINKYSSYFLTGDWADLKWHPVLKVWEQLQEKILCNI